MRRWRPHRYGRSRTAPSRNPVRAHQTEPTVTPLRLPHGGDAGPAGCPGEGGVQDVEAEVELGGSDGQGRGDAEAPAHTGQLDDVHVEAQVQALGSDLSAQILGG